MRCLKPEEASIASYDEVARRLQTDLNNGLSWKEANLRLRICGYNEFDVKNVEPVWQKYIEQVSYW